MQFFIIISKSKTFFYHNDRFDADIQPSQLSTGVLLLKSVSSGYNFKLILWSILSKLTYSKSSYIFNFQKFPIAHFDEPRELFTVTPQIMEV